MNLYAAWQEHDLAAYSQRSHIVTHQEWLNLSIAWTEDGATILDAATMSESGAVQCHVLHHRRRIHAIYTLSDVPAVRGGAL